MRNLYFLLLWVFLTLGGQLCQGQEAVLAPLVKARFQALKTHDLSALGKLYADSARLESPNWEGASWGPAGIREVYRRYFSSTPDLQFEVSRLTFGQGVVVVEYLSQGTLTDPEKGSPEYMRGKSYRLKNCTRLEYRDGKIINETSYFDQVAFLRQVGFFDQFKP